MQHERGRIWFSLDLLDGRTKRRGHVGIRRLVEADMTVADLNEAETAAAMRHRRRQGCLAERRPSQDPARHGPCGARTDPRHALEKVSPIQLALVIVTTHNMPPYGRK